MEEPAKEAVPSDAQKTIDTFVVTILAFVLSVTAFLWILDTFKFKRKRFRAGTGWVVVLLTSSYALLIPGLVTELFSFQITFGLGGADGIKVPIMSLTESTVSFVGELSNSGSWAGAAFIVLYAMVIPAVKIVLLILGEVWYDSGKAWKVRSSRRCILTLHSISKWASPDMFAYVLLLCLFRKMHHPPDLISEGRLSMGFTCFSIFCVGSTIGTLGVHPPTEPWDESIRGPRPNEAKPPYLARVCGGWLLTATVTFFFAAFIALLIVGVVRPVMSLRLDLDILLESRGLPAMLKPFLEESGIASLAKVDVSLAESIAQLEIWASGGEANSVVAWILLSVFVVALPVLDMLAILIAGFSKGGACGPRLAGVRRCWCCAKIRHLIGEVFDGYGQWFTTSGRLLMKLSMLDVAIMGVVVVVLAGRVYRSDGIFLTISEGGFFLAGAEICHYAAFCAVTLGEVSPEPEVSASSVQSPAVRPRASARAKARAANLRRSGSGAHTV